MQLGCEVLTEGSLFCTGNGWQESVQKGSDVYSFL